MKYRSNCLTFYLVKSHPKTLIFLINGRSLICADTVGTINLHIVFHKICLIIFKNPLTICLPILSLDPCLGMLLVKFSSPFVMSILKSHYNPKIVMMMMTVAHFIDGWFGCQNAHYGVETRYRPFLGKKCYTTNFFDDMEHLFHYIHLMIFKYISRVRFHFNFSILYYISFF